MSIHATNATKNIKALACKPCTQLLWTSVIRLSFSPLSIGATVEVNIDVNRCDNVTSLEHVTANVSYTFHRRGDVKVTLISPSQTASELISFRENDASEKGSSSCELTTKAILFL